MSRDAETIYQQIRADMPAWWGGAPGEVIDAFLRAVADAESTLEQIDDTFHDRTFIGTADGMWLDEHGFERGVQRLSGETDAAYRVRLIAIPDVVTPVAVIAGAQTAMLVLPAKLLELTSAGFFLDYSFLDYSRFWPVTPPYFILRIPAQVPTRADRAYLVAPGVNIDVRTFLGDGTGTANGLAVAMFLDGVDLVGSIIYRQIYDTVNRIRAGGVPFRIEVAL